jgi:hypothetical protein
MKLPDQYNFSLFNPRNLHGKKNRNVILTMLLIWVVAVFGFQFLLWGIQKPTPEKALSQFESTWPDLRNGDLSGSDHKAFLHALVLVKGKNTVKPDDQVVISNAISCVTFKSVPDSVKVLIFSAIAEKKLLKEQLVQAKDQAYLDVKTRIEALNIKLAGMCEPFTGFPYGSLEASIFTGSLNENFPASLDDNSYTRLPDIMQLYLTHNQSVLTDTIFLGFPFHYFYTAVFLLILFITLCIVYNILIEWRLKKEGVVES